MLLRLGILVQVVQRKASKIINQIKTHLTASSLIKKSSLFENALDVTLGMSNGSQKLGPPA